MCNYLDEALHDDHLDLGVGEGVLEAVAEDEAQGEALARLVRAGARLGGEHAPELVEHPVARGIEPLEVLLGTAGPVDGAERGAGSVRDRLGFARDAEERAETARASEGTRATATSADASRGEGADAHLASPSWSRAEARRKEGRAGLDDATSFANEWRASVR